MNKFYKVIFSFIAIIFIVMMSIVNYRRSQWLILRAEEMNKHDDSEYTIVESTLLPEYNFEDIPVEEDVVETENPPVVEVVEEPELISLGEFKLTSYCSCKKCCGKWALNRPVDENGNEIVYGSSGEILIAGVSIAVDTNIISHGSEVIINGQTYIAHDTGGAIKGNRIDVYHDSHQEAREFGVQYAEVFLVVND